MRNVTRVAKPLSLHKNAPKWKRELLAALREKKQDRQLVAKLFNRYNCRDVRESLGSMYGDLCCYCEAPVAVVAFEHIEHRKPKRKFPADTFAWRNLHLGCPKCNQAKGDLWTASAPILDCVFDQPIKRHMTYDFREVLGCVSLPLSKRGATTIEHADLNREKLCSARTTIAHGVLGTIAALKSAPKSPSVSILRSELSKKTKGPFGSLVEWLLDTYMTAA